MMIKKDDMGQVEHHSYVVEQDDCLLITGATGFIGSRLVETLLDRGFRNLRCFARPSSDTAGIKVFLTRL